MATTARSEPGRAAWPAVVEFDLALRASVCEQEPTATGTVLRYAPAPSMWDLNFVYVRRRGMTADALEADAERALAGLPHRMLILDEPYGTLALAGTMSARGWTVERWLAMVAGPVPPGRAVRGPVREVPPPGIQPTRRRAMAESGFDEPLISLVEGVDRDVGAVAAERAFAALGEDGRPVAIAKLYTDGATGQIEDVATLEAHRGRGHGQDVVLEALRASRAAGHDVTFLWADEAATAKDLYAKLGFVTVGARWRVRRVANA